jgi:hypothetical protein
MNAGFGSGELYGMDEPERQLGAIMGRCGQCDRLLMQYEAMGGAKRRSCQECGLMIVWSNDRAWVIVDHGIHRRCAAPMCESDGGVTGGTRRCAKCRKECFDVFGARP